MPTALTQPTGTQITSLFLDPTGKGPKVGEYTATQIDAYITADTSHNVVTREFERAKEIISDAGMDHTALDDTNEYPYAWNALRYICAYRILELDLEQRACQKDSKPLDAEYKKLYSWQVKICSSWKEINVTDNLFCYDKYKGSYEVIDYCNDRY